MNTASRMSTGMRARPQWAAWARIMSFMLHDFQRSEPFCLAVVAVVESRRRADRKYHWQPERNGEIEVELGAEVVVAVTAPVRGLGCHGAGEQCRADVAQIEG